MCRVVLYGMLVWFQFEHQTNWDKRDDLLIASFISNQLTLARSLSICSLFTVLYRKVVLNSWIEILLLFVEISRHKSTAWMKIEFRFESSFNNSFIKSLLTFVIFENVTRNIGIQFFLDRLIKEGKLLVCVVCIEISIGAIMCIYQSLMKCVKSLQHNQMTRVKKTKTNIKST